MNQPSQLPSNIHVFKPASAVLYSIDYEPISHIPMNNQMYEYFMKYELVRFPVSAPIDMNNFMSDVKITDANIQYAEIAAMRVHSADGIRLILIAKDDSTALLMRNSFLPGQTKEVNFTKSKAFYQGMVKAMLERKK